MDPKRTRKKLPPKSTKKNLKTDPKKDEQERAKVRPMSQKGAFWDIFKKERARIRAARSCAVYTFLKFDQIENISKMAGAFAKNKKLTPP